MATDYNYDEVIKKEETLKLSLEDTKELIGIMSDMRKLLTRVLKFMVKHPKLASTGLKDCTIPDEIQEELESEIDKTDAIMTQADKAMKEQSRIT